MADANGRRAAYETATDTVFLFFVVISSDDLPEPLRFVGSFNDVSTGGYTYIAYPFSLTLPSDDGETVASVSLVIGNVGRELVNVIRSISSDINITFWIATHEDPESIQEGPFTMGLVDTKMDVLTITGTLTTEPIMSQSVCDYTVTPVTCPGVFKGTVTDS